MVRKTVLDGIKFNEEDEYQGHEDLDVWLRICAVKKATIISEKQIFYRVHSNQLSTHLNKNYKKQSFEILKAHYYYFNFMQKCIYMFRIFVYKISKQ